jgi:lipopolysaccharide/colanic/teichoic acid biosynthesis glycosyltransferase
MGRGDPLARQVGDVAVSVGDEEVVADAGELRVGETAAARPGGNGAAFPVDIDLVALEAEERSDEQNAIAAAPAPFALRVARALDGIRTEHVTPPIWAYDASKRAVDMLLSPLLFVVALPLIVLLAIVVKLDSRGPAIFRQTRVGKDGQLFTFYKFRTMYVDARERFPDLYAYDYGDEEVETMFFKLASDPRCTRVGRLLRRTSLDELPNVINVLKGDMALVGPRPEIPDMLPNYRPEQLAKFTVKPGLTGLAQISGRNLLTFQETIRHDLEYVEKRTLWFDLYILFRTPIVVVQMIGAL